MLNCPTLRQNRAKGWATRPRGYRKLFLESVTQADEGCDFRFLRAPEIKVTVPK